MYEYELADMNRRNSRVLAMAEEMRNLPEEVKSVETNEGTGTKTYVFTNGHRVTCRIDERIDGSKLKSIAKSNISDSKLKSSVKPSTSHYKANVAELKASLKKTMREAYQNISDFTKRSAQLDVEISRATMRGQYAGTMKCKRDDLLQRINKLEAIKSRCSALLCGA